MAYVSLLTSATLVVYGGSLSSKKHVDESGSISSLPSLGATYRWAHAHKVSAAPPALQVTWQPSCVTHLKLIFPSLLVKAGGHARTAPNKLQEKSTLL